MGRAQLQALRIKFELLNMKEGEKVDNFLGRTLTVVNKMKSNGEIMEQNTMASKVLRSLTSKFNYVICSIEESNDLSTSSIDELHRSLLSSCTKNSGIPRRNTYVKGGPGR